MPEFRQAVIEMEAREKAEEEAAKKAAKEAKAAKKAAKDKELYLKLKAQFE